MPNSTPAFEKCTEEIKVRVPASMRAAIEQICWADDRSPSEYVRHVLAVHLYGHARQLAEQSAKVAGPNVPSQGTRNILGD